MTPQEYATLITLKLAFLKGRLGEIAALLQTPDRLEFDQEQRLEKQRADLLETIRFFESMLDLSDYDDDF